MIRFRNTNILWIMLFLNIYSAKTVNFYTKIRDHLKYWGFAHILHFFKLSPRLLCDFASIFCQSHYFCCQLQSHPFPTLQPLPTHHQPKSMSNINIPLEILLYRSMNNKVKLCSAFLWGTKLVNNTTWNHGSLMIVHSLLYLSSFSLVMIISRTVFFP